MLVHLVVGEQVFDELLADAVMAAIHIIIRLPVLGQEFFKPRQARGLAGARSDEADIGTKMLKDQPACVAQMLADSRQCLELVFDSQQQQERAERNHDQLKAFRQLEGAHVADEQPDTRGDFGEYTANFSWQLVSMARDESRPVISAPASAHGSSTRPVPHASSSTGPVAWRASST
jgi:hypothetical protein